MKTIIVLGAGWTGLPLAHKLLKYTLPKTSLKVILVSPNTHFFWNVAATRALIPGSIADERIFLPIAPGFAKYKESFEMLLGKADGIDTTDNKVKVVLNTGSVCELQYDHLIIATGSKLEGNVPLKPIGTHEETQARWKALQKQIADAKSIVIGGAGATGVEVAGELAAKYGGAKKVTLVAAGELPLANAEGVLPSVRATIASDLNKLGVDVIRNVRVKSADEVGGQVKVQLSNGDSLVADYYLPLHGVRVNTSFLPSKFLDDRGNICVDDHMRLVGRQNVWAIGDVGNREPKQITITDNQINYLAKTLDSLLTGAKEVAAYQPEAKTLVFLSMGTKYATGQVGRWKLFGFLVSWVKGRSLFVDTAEGYVGGKQLRHGAL